MYFSGAHPSRNLTCSDQNVFPTISGKIQQNLYKTHPLNIKLIVEIIEKKYCEKSFKVVTQV